MKQGLFYDNKFPLFNLHALFKIILAHLSTHSLQWTRQNLHYIFLYSSNSIYWSISAVDNIKIQIMQEPRRISNQYVNGKIKRNYEYVKNIFTKLFLTLAFEMLQYHNVIQLCNKWTFSLYRARWQFHRVGLNWLDNELNPNKTNLRTFMTHVP